MVWGPRRDARPAGERRSGGALEGYPKRKRGDPTWSAARDDAYAQKERLGGEPYRPSPSGDSATPIGDYKLVPPAGANESLTTIYFFFIISESPGQNIPIE